MKKMLFILYIFILVLIITSIYYLKFIRETPITETRHFTYDYPYQYFTCQEQEDISEEAEYAYNKICKYLKTGYPKNIILHLKRGQSLSYIENNHLFIFDLKNDYAAIMHELTNLLMGPAPALFYEGLGVYMQNCFGRKRGYIVYYLPSDLYVLASLETGQYISLEDLAFKKTYLFRRQKYQRIIALQQAGSFVKYLIEKYGLNTFRQIYISRVQKFEKYYNKSLAQLEDEWLMDLKNKRLSNKQKAREKLAEVFIYNWLDMPDESLTACKEAVSIAPDDDMACAYLALAHYYHKNYMMSIDYARLSLENNPDNIGALVALAASHLRVGNLNEAENIATEALNNIYMACCHWGFYTVFAKCILGEVCLKNNNTKQGVKYYEEAIALSDEDLKVKTYQGFHYNLGLAYKKQGKLDKAEDEFKKVIESSQVAEKVITASPARGPQNQFADKAREELKKF